MAPCPVRGSPACQAGALIITPKITLPRLYMSRLELCPLGGATDLSLCAGLLFLHVFDPSVTLHEHLLPLFQSHLHVSQTSVSLHHRLLQLGPVQLDVGQLGKMGSRSVGRNRSRSVNHKNEGQLGHRMTTDTWITETQVVHDLQEHMI